MKQPSGSILGPNRLLAATMHLTILIQYANAAWVPVAYDMVESSSHNLNSHGNNWEGAFSSSHDGFQKYTRGVSSIPAVILDDSDAEPEDTLGLIPNADTEEFFGVADTVNSQTSGPISATWDFDIAGHDIKAIQIDAAAMGDFERTGTQPDWFVWLASVDGGSETVIFDGVTDTSLTLAYTLVSGHVVELVDPMTVNGIVLSNEFQTVTSAYSAQGTTLTLRLEAIQEGSSEAMAFRNIKVLADNGGPTSAPTLFETCPEENCSNDVVTTMNPPVDCDPTSLEIVTLGSYMHDGFALVELLGPANPADAAAIVLASPHGGYLEPSFIEERDPNNSIYCPSDGCTVVKDSYSKELALEIQNKVRENYCKIPYLVVNNLHRNRLDANREIGEAAHGHEIAEGAWLDFHNFISEAQHLVKASFGTVTGSTGLNGVVGLMLDVHGYAGKDWVETDGAPYIQWGYNMHAGELSHCPADAFSGVYPDNDDTFSHLSTLSGKSLECLVRGPGSLGSRVQGVGVERCGVGLPSFEFPDPEALANDCSYCQDICPVPGVQTDSCYYYGGGSYDSKVHEYLGWQDSSGDLFNTVQAEFPRCVRFDATMRSVIADSLSVGICSFLQDVFGLGTETCGSTTSLATPKPTAAPTREPTSAPTRAPTTSPTSAPTRAPTTSPTSAPTRAPTASPTPAPTPAPTSSLTPSPTSSRTSSPTTVPTRVPTTAAPTTSVPTNIPTTNPVVSPTGSQAWVVVAYDMVGSSNMNLQSHDNIWEGAFSSRHDGFQKYTRGVSSIPAVILDDSMLRGDSMGVITDTDTDEFFGVADTVNRQASDPVSATWQFDITGHDITAIEIDAAAMGNFEQTGSQPDWFVWRASIDGGSETVVFDGVTDASSSFSYTLASGDTVEMDDPMMMNGILLSNTFQTVRSPFAGRGTTLTLRLEAIQEGSSEAMAFRNIKILADDYGLAEDVSSFWGS